MPSLESLVESACSLLSTTAVGYSRLGLVPQDRTFEDVEPVFYRPYPLRVADRQEENTGDHKSENTRA